MEKKSSHPAGTKEFWQERYMENKTPWDLDGFHPAIELLNQKIKFFLKEDPTVYVPGMGKGHDAAFWAKCGYNTIGGDASPKAVEVAQALYKNVSHLKLKTLDAIEGTEPDSGTIDLIYDRAMLCALPNPSQFEYLKSCARRLDHGGLFATIAFTKLSNEDGPPWSVSCEKIEGYFADLNHSFKLLLDFPIEVDYESSVIQGESLMVWQKS